MTIYAIPGLGADERVFERLSIKAKPVQWLKPEYNETFEAYVQRLCGCIDTSTPFILLGVSFGGMVAVEMNKFVQPEKTILISSAATKEELPVIIRWIRKGRIFRFIPLFKPPLFVARYIFGVNTSRARKLLENILKDTDPKFLKWAIGKIIYWNNREIPANLIRIHGEKDRLLKMKKKVEYEVVKNGGHFMVVEQAEEVSRIIQSHITY